MKKKRDSTPLLMREAPILSDDMPPSPVKEAAPSSSSQQNKKKFGLKRLFGNKKKKDSSPEPQQQQQQQQQTHKQAPMQSILSLRSKEEQVATAVLTARTQSSASRQRVSPRRNDSQDDEKKSEASSPANDDAHHDNYDDDFDEDEWAVKDLLGDGNDGDNVSFHDDTNTRSAMTAAAALQLVASSTSTSENSHAPQEGALKPPTTPLSPGTLSFKSSIKSILSRPFGREHVDKSLQRWSIQVSSAEWDTDERHWKYRIQLVGNESGVLQASTFRSLADFAWLEQALLQEYAGGMLLPTLSISLGVPDDLDQYAQHEVEPKLLQQWLSDVLHGLRGQGELWFRQPEEHGVELLASESMEAFWYRSTAGPLSESVSLDPLTPVNLNTPTSTRRSIGIGNHVVDCPGSPQFDDNNPWSKWAGLELCTGCQPADDDEAMDRNNNPTNTTPKRNKAIMNLGMVRCASRALGDAESLDVQDSFVDASGTLDKKSQPSSSSLAIHSELVQAEKELCWNWRTRALASMEKLRVLQEQEKHVGSAWKRFAISVSNLFSYEKDVESARLGDSKARRELQMPYRKLQKSAVDDCLRVLARSKFERSTPALESVSGMLAAFVADLSAVPSCVEAYGLGIQQLSLAQQRLFKQQQKQQQNAASKNSVASTAPSTAPQSLADQFQATLTQVQKMAGASVSSQNDTNGYSQTQQQQQQHQDEQMQQRVQAMEFRVLRNEALLKDSLTCLCKATLVRTSRMAYRYFNVDAMQTVMLHSAAANVRQKISLSSKDALVKMIHRHSQETKEDHATELGLVQRIVNLGNIKKFSDSDDNTQVVDGHEIDTDVDNDQAHRAKLRDECLMHCRQRIGRWDAKLALSIMEAVGVDDANVRVEETTRDLRMVRKYAIGLRENVQRCSEALDILRMSILQGGLGDIRDIRHDFMSELQTIFSSTYPDNSDVKSSTPKRKSESPSRGVLSGAGINLTDPAGWTRIQKGSCGESCQTYMDCRESGTEWLLESLGELLKEYNQRVESIESFVYMECVGIQLEKHFSQSRGTALAAFEKKTDITSAINIATRKRMPKLVQELQTKLEAVDPNVSHTTVKEAKEAHLESKALKAELSLLSDRRLTRGRETSTERVIALMAVWAKEEESAAAAELKVLKTIIKTMEKAMSKDDITAYLSAAPIAKVQADV